MCGREACGDREALIVARIPSLLLNFASAEWGRCENRSKLHAAREQSNYARHVHPCDRFKEAGSAEQSGADDPAVTKRYCQTYVILLVSV